MKEMQANVHLIWPLRNCPDIVKLKAEKQRYTFLSVNIRGKRIDIGDYVVFNMVANTAFSHISVKIKRTSGDFFTLELVILLPNTFGPTTASPTVIHFTSSFFVVVLQTYTRCCTEMQIAYTTSGSSISKPQYLRVMQQSYTCRVWCTFSVLLYVVKQIELCHCLCTLSHMHELIPLLMYYSYSMFMRTKNKELSL